MRIFNTAPTLESLKRLAAGAFAVALLASGSPATALAEGNETLTCNVEMNLLGNASFEQPTITDPENWDVFPSPVGAWTVEWTNSDPAEGKPEVANLEFHKDGFYGSADGDQFAELDSSWSGPGGSTTAPHDASVRIYQDIPTIPGATYTISFAFSPRPGYDADDNQLSIAWDGANVDAISADGTSLENTSWVTHNYQVVATDSLSRIEFSDTGTPNSFGTFLDDTALSCVSTPEIPPTGTTACSNGIDDDEDGLIDMEDSGCDSPEDDREHNSSRGGGGGGSVLGASTGPEPQVLGESCGMYITTYIKLGQQNDSADVMRLQTFLNEEMGAKLPVNGTYDVATMNVLKAFQVKYKDEVLTPWANHGLTSDEAANGTGYVYKTTQRWINMLKCAELNLPVPQLP